MGWRARQKICYSRVVKPKDKSQTSTFCTDIHVRESALPQHAEQYSCLMKILLVGESASGKTNLLGRSRDQDFRPQHRVTVGVEFGSRIVEVARKSIKLQCWDLSLEKTRVFQN